MLQPVLRHPHDFNFAFPKEDFALLCIPKCGSTTLRDSLAASYNRLPREQVMGYKTRFAVIRNPVLRVISAWRDKWPEIQFDQWWRFVKMNPFFDAHTAPYYPTLAGAYTHLYRLEDISRWWPIAHLSWPRLFPAQPLYKNVSSGQLEIPPRFWLEAAEVYAADMALWNGANVPPSEVSLYTETHSSHPRI